MEEKAVILYECAANGSRCLLEAFVKTGRRDPRRADGRDHTAAPRPVRRSAGQDTHQSLSGYVGNTNGSL